MAKWGLFQRCKADSVFKNPCDPLYQRLKNKNNMIISTSFDAEKVFDKI